MSNSKGFFTINTHVFLLYALILLIVPIKWVAGWSAAAVMHEFGHIVALKVFKVRIFGIQIGISGARIITEPMSNFPEALCAMAGPLAGFLLILLMNQFPYVALSGAIHSIFNLIPVFPLDGGRAVRCLLQSFFSVHTANCISVIINISTVVAFVGIGVWIALRYDVGMLPIVFPAIPILCVMWKNTLQRTKKNSTIRRRTIL